MSTHLTWKFHFITRPDRQAEGSAGYFRDVFKFRVFISGNYRNYMNEALGESTKLSCPKLYKIQ